MKNGDLVAYISYAVVESKESWRIYAGPELSVRDRDTRQQYYIRGSELHDRLLSADDFGETKKVTMTELAEKLVAVGQYPFTVCFDKADGTERVLRGRYVAHEVLLGRSKVEDLDLDTDRMRLVDHRTLKYLIVGGIKYELKGKK